MYRRSLFILVLLLVGCESSTRVRYPDSGGDVLLGEGLDASEGGLGTGESKPEGVYSPGYEIVPGLPRWSYM